MIDCTSKEIAYSVSYVFLNNMINNFNRISPQSGVSFLPMAGMLVIVKLGDFTRQRFLSKPSFSKNRLNYTTTGAAIPPRR